MDGLNFKYIKLTMDNVHGLDLNNSNIPSSLRNCREITKTFFKKMKIFKQQVNGKCQTSWKAEEVL